MTPQWIFPLFLMNYVIYITYKQAVTSWMAYCGWSNTLSCRLCVPRRSMEPGRILPND